MPVVGNNPTLVPQGGTIFILAGDSYQASESREYEWVEEPSKMAWSTLTSATIKFKARNRYGTSLEVTGEVKTATGSPKKVAVELTAAQTETLIAGEYTFAIVATLSGSNHVETLSRGKLIVEKQTTE